MLNSALYFYRPANTLILLFVQCLPSTLINYLPLVVGALPLSAAFVVGWGGRQRFFYWLGSVLLAGAMLLGWYLLVLAYHGATWHLSFTWLRISDSSLSHSLLLGVWVDFPVAVMMGLTTTISFWVHLYALTYLQAASRRYIVLAGGFVSAMLGFWMANTLLGRFIGWELIGWGSYLFIGLGYPKEAAAKYSTQAWLINQLGSISLLMGILLIGSALGTLDLEALAALPRAIYRNHDWLGVASFCLVVGVCTKSAQWPWFSWLSNAMTAPTPASALIHTATLVGAGVYLLVGLAPLLGVATLTGVAYVGALTTLMGAYAALTQQHAKQVLAYSTISQLGYAVMAVGVGASSVGLFHFVTHAFSKACLFLCLGAVSQFVGTDSMQNMGGLRKVCPGVFCVYLLAAFSLVGMPGFAGKLSKEAVLACTWAWAQEQALAGHYLGYAVPAFAWVASLLAVVYMGRQCYLVFMGPPRWSSRSSPTPAHRTSWCMQGSMAMLALGTLGRWYGPLLGDVQGSWLLQRLGPLPLTVPLQHGALLASLLAIILGCVLLVGWKCRVLSPLPAVGTQLSLQGWYLDTLVHAVAQLVLGLSRILAHFEHRVVQGLFLQGVSVGYVVLGHVVSWLDRALLGGLVLLVAAVPRYVGKAHRLTQQGGWQHALLWMFVGIGLLGWGIYWTMQGKG